jgi:hypothetical protein
MNRTFLAVLAFLGTLAFLVLFLADREMQASLERLSGYKFPHRSTLDKATGLNLVITHSIRIERREDGGAEPPRQTIQL